MIVKSLSLCNFRNYEEQSITFNNGLNILFGQNAQGKTNILEALYLTATGKSHRTNSYQDLVRSGNSFFELTLTALLNDAENRIKIRYTKEKGKYIEINGIKREKMSDIIGTFNIIMFSPESLEVIKGSPQLRRKFLDILLCQMSRKYLYYLQQYNKLIKNKSAALKKGKYEKKYEEVIPIWNERISFFGGKIAAFRLKTIKSLNRFMKEEIKKITANCEISDISYRTFCDYDIDSDEKYFEYMLNEKLKHGLDKELSIAQCLYGTHRDDFEILLNSMNSRHYCSQGQQRSLALSLIIAELRLIEEDKGEKPVLLLDDVMSELDLSRQEYLLSGLFDVQTIVTTTDYLAFNNIVNRDIKRVYVEKGRLFNKS